MAEMPKLQEQFSAASGTFSRQREKGKHLLLLVCAQRHSCRRLDRRSRIRSGRGVNTKRMTIVGGAALGRLTFT
jgi:hypothetical protein